ncbi:ATP-binding protein [Streptomyces sp. NPDC016309]|uniref:ATP-binding protein n=1 Tax=Streptomyces sp. NPDC016309 TaxID=3364965 RepID=UPI003701FD23
MDPLVLAATSASIVGALATDAWQPVRDRMVDLVRHAQPDEADNVSLELEEARELILAARDDDDARVEHELTVTLQRRLQDLVGDDPAVDPNVLRLLGQLLVSSRNTLLSQPASLSQPAPLSVLTAWATQGTGVPVLPLPGLLGPAAPLTLPEGDPSAVAAACLPVPTVFDRLGPARMLPRDVSAFTGREPEMEQLLEAADATDEPSVCLVHGMPGVGKTALAVHTAHRVTDRFPDGQLFINLRGHDPGDTPASPFQLLGTLLTAAGFPAGVQPASVHGRAGMWRSYLSSKRMMIILDDAADFSQVEPLLPGYPGCLTLVTSRLRLEAAEVTRSVPVDELAPDASARLFDRLLRHRGYEGEAGNAHEVARLCGNLPLALVFAASVLLAHPTWRVPHLVDDLSRSQRRLTRPAGGRAPVSEALDTSVRTLDDTERHFLRRLGMHPGPELEKRAAAVLAGTSVEDADQFLDSLYRHSLLTEVSPGRFRMHVLVSSYLRAAPAEQFARAGAPDDTVDEEEVRRRLVDYYRRTATAAYLVETRQETPDAVRGSLPERAPSLSGPSQAAAWLAAELDNLAACTQYTADHPEVVADLATVVTAYLLRRGDTGVRTARELVEAGHRRVTSRGDVRAQALFTHLSGLLALAENDIAASVADLERAVRTSLADGWTLGAARALYGLYLAQRLSGRYDRALSALDEAAELFTEAGDRYGQRKTYEQGARPADALPATGADRTVPPPMTVDSVSRPAPDDFLTQLENLALGLRARRVPDEAPPGAASRGDVPRDTGPEEAGPHHAAGSRGGGDDEPPSTPTGPPGPADDEGDHGGGDGDDRDDADLTDTAAEAEADRTDDGDTEDPEDPEDIDDRTGDTGADLVARRRETAERHVPSSEETAERHVLPSEELDAVDAQLVNFWFTDDGTAGDPPLRVAERRTGCFQVGPDHPDNLAAGDRVVPPHDIPAAGLLTHWVVWSSTCELALPDDADPSFGSGISVSGDAQQWNVDFTLLIPPHGPSEERPVIVTPRQAGTARIDALVLVDGDPYRELTIEFPVDEADPGEPRDGLRAGSPNQPSGDPPPDPEPAGLPHQRPPAAAPPADEPKPAAAQVARALCPPRSPRRRHGSVQVRARQHVPARETAPHPAQGWQREARRLSLYVNPPGVWWCRQVTGTPGEQTASTAWKPQAAAHQYIRDAQLALDAYWQSRAQRYNDITASDVAKRLEAFRPSTDWSAPGVPSLRDEDEEAWHADALSQEVRDLALAGHHLFQAMFPDAQLSRMVRELEPGDRLTIHWENCDPQHVPWPLMYRGTLPRPGQPVQAHDFLGLRLRISHVSHPSFDTTRALDDDAVRAHLMYWGGKPNDETLLAAEEHARELSGWRPKVLPATSEGRKAQLAEFLWDPSPVSLIYVFCQASTGAGNKPSLRFGSTSDACDVLQLTDMGIAPMTDRPLVFINACETSAAEHTYSNELQNTFLKRGSRAYIGSECKVPTNFAARFASVFFHFLYTREHEGSPTSAGEALAQTRKFFWDEYRSIGGLFYSYVNDYHVRIAKPHEVAALHRPDPRTPQPQSQSQPHPQPQTRARQA